MSYLLRIDGLIYGLLSEPIEERKDYKMLRATRFASDIKQSLSGFSPVS